MSNLYRRILFELSTIQFNREHKKKKHDNMANFQFPNN